MDHDDGSVSNLLLRAGSTARLDMADTVERVMVDMTIQRVDRSFADDRGVASLLWLVLSDASSRRPLSHCDFELVNMEMVEVRVDSTLRAEKITLGVYQEDDMLDEGSAPNLYHLHLAGPPGSAARIANASNGLRWIGLPLALCSAQHVVEHQLQTDGAAIIHFGARAVELVQQEGFCLLRVDDKCDALRVAQPGGSFVAAQDAARTDDAGAGAGAERLVVLWPGATLCLGDVQLVLAPLLHGAPSLLLRKRPRNDGGRGDEDAKRRKPDHANPSPPP